MKGDGPVDPLWPGLAVRPPKLLADLPRLGVLIARQAPHDALDLVRPWPVPRPLAHEHAKRPANRPPDIDVRVADARREQLPESRRVRDCLDELGKSRLCAEPDDIVRSSYEVDQRRDVEPLEGRGEGRAEARGEGGEEVKRGFREGGAFGKDLQRKRGGSVRDRAV